MNPEDLFVLLSPRGPGRTAEDLAKDLGHPLHEYRQRGMCECIPLIHKHLEALTRQRKVYRLGQYFWQQDRA